MAAEAGVDGILISNHGGSYELHASPMVPAEHLNIAGRQLE